MKFLLIANPENRRAGYFIEACSRAGFPKPRVVSWLEVLRSDWKVDWGGVDALRIDSPGENFQVEQQLLLLGARAAEKEGRYASLPEPAVRSMQEEHGRLRFGRQWFHGWRQVLQQLQTRRPAGVTVMNPPGDIALMFDKQASQEKLAGEGVETAERLGIVNGFDDLVTRLEKTTLSRVFLKPCHSSSASGVVAFERSGGRMRATTSVSMERNSGGARLFNSLRLSRYRDPAEIRALVDTLAGERLMAERWFPKASHAGKAFDLRVLVIAGKARHVVMRTSRLPITNLHLGNERGDIEALQAEMGERRWAEAMRCCERAADVFADCLYVAVDLLVGVGLRRFCVAEVNAFGDLIPRTVSHGMNTYAAELAAFRLQNSH